MDPITQQTVLAAAGAAGADPVYVDDVFSTYLYDGTNSNQSINNGIDLAGEGGLVWIKGRGPTGWQHILVDTERGATKHLSTNNNSGQSTSSNTVPTFSSTGFATGTDNQINYSSETAGYASWTFRKAPGFFDVVTYTGNGGTQNIAHSLGSVPGMIVIKSTSAAGDWWVYHRSIGPAEVGRLNDDDPFFSYTSPPTFPWNNTTPTSTEFSLSNNNAFSANISGTTYVAYIFAHDEPVFGTDGDESIIKCGSYTGSSANNYTQEINLGFEPQWLLVKGDANSLDWHIVDTMRGFTGSGTSGDAQALSANVSNVEPHSGGKVRVTPTGFKIEAEGSSQWNASGTTFIYMAIRRPNKPPEVGTDVFAVTTRRAATPGGLAGFPVDLWLQRQDINTTGNPFLINRLTAGGIATDYTGTESNYGSGSFDSNTGIMRNGYNVPTEYFWLFKRAPGFMDVVAYIGSTTLTQNVPHNLGVVPEMMIIKNRDAADNWIVYHTAIGATKFIRLNTNQDPSSSGSLAWNDTAPTASVFTLGNNGWGGTNYNGQRFIAYLFATLPGISKVGSYSGSSNAQNIDCGFTNGARFVLIKRTDTTGNWFLFDTLRGIVSGNESALRLDISDAPYTTFDFIAPHSAGFTLNASMMDTNYGGGTYMFLAIA